MRLCEVVDIKARTWEVSRGKSEFLRSFLRKGSQSMRCSSGMKNEFFYGKNSVFKTHLPTPSTSFCSSYPETGNVPRLCQNKVLRRALRDWRNPHPKVLWKLGTLSYLKPSPVTLATSTCLLPNIMANLSFFPNFSMSPVEAGGPLSGESWIFQ